MCLIVCVYQCQEEFKAYVRENEEIKRQIEEDNDREITNLKTNYELRLREERDQVQVTNYSLIVYKRWTETARHFRCGSLSYCIVF